MKNTSERDSTFFRELKDPTFFVKLKMYTNLLSYKLKNNKDIDAIIHPNYHPSKIEDGHYLYILKNNPNSKNDFSDFILSLCQKNINIKIAFDKNQIKMITQIAKEITLKDVKKFYDFEFERLQREVKPDDIKENNIEIKENLYGKKVSGLIASFKTNPSQKINLDVKTFFPLIREYCLVTDFERNTPSDEELKQIRNRLHEISTLIHQNRESVDFFKNPNVIDNPKLKSDIIVYMHELCYNGDIDNFETLIKDYLSEKDLSSVVNEIDQKSNFNGIVTISGLNNIMDKRINLQSKDGSGPQKDSSRWKDVKEIFNNALKSKNPDENGDRPSTLLSKIWKFLALGEVFENKSR